MLKGPAQKASDNTKGKMEMNVRVGNDMVVQAGDRVLRKKAQGPNWTSSIIVAKRSTGFEVIEVWHLITRRRYDSIEAAIAAFDEER